MEKRNWYRSFKEKESIYNLFLTSAATKLLNAIYYNPNKNKYSITLKAGITYSYSSKLFDIFEQLNLINVDKTFHTRLVKLKPKGEKLYSLFKEVEELDQESKAKKMIS